MPGHKQDPISETVANLCWILCHGSTSHVCAWEWIKKIRRDVTTSLDCHTHATSGKKETTQILMLILDILSFPHSLQQILAVVFIPCATIGSDQHVAIKKRLSFHGISLQIRLMSFFDEMMMSCLTEHYGYYLFFYH